MKFIVSKLFRLHSYKRLFTKVLSPFIPFKQIDNPVVYMTLYVKDEEDIITGLFTFRTILQPVTGPDSRSEGAEYH